MADVFISYSDKSPKAAEEIADELDRAGISYWLARRHMKIGQSFPKEIQKAIKNCKVFLLILDKNSNQSEHVLNEINLAFRRKNNHETIDFLVFKTDDCKVSIDIDYFLNRFQHMDGNPPDAQCVWDLTCRITDLLGKEILPNEPKQILKSLENSKINILFKGAYIFFAGTLYMSAIRSFEIWRIYGYLYSLIDAGIDFYGLLVMLLMCAFSHAFSVKESVGISSIPLLHGIHSVYLWSIEGDSFLDVLIYFGSAVFLLSVGIVADCSKKLTIRDIQHK